MLLDSGLNLKIIKYGSTTLAFDTETMEIFEIDDITMDIINNLIRYTSEETLNILYKKYPSAVIREKMDEIEESITMGFLSTKVFTEQNLERKRLVNGEIRQVELVVGEYSPPNSKIKIPGLTVEEAIQIIDWVVQENVLMQLLVKFVGSYNTGGVRLIQAITNYVEQLMDKDNLTLYFSIEIQPQDIENRALVELIYNKDFFVQMVLTDSVIDKHAMMQKIANFNKTLDDRKSYIVKTSSKNVNEIIKVLDFCGLENYWLQPEDFSDISVWDSVIHLGDKVLGDYIQYNNMPKLRYIRETIRRLGTMKGPKLFGCSAGKNQMTFYAGKKILPCKKFFSYEQFDMGVLPNINRGLQRQFLMESCFARERCKNCWCKTLCGGGCEHVHRVTQDFVSCVAIQKLSEIAILLYSFMLSNEDPKLEEIMLQDI